MPMRRTTVVGAGVGLLAVGAAVAFAVRPALLVAYAPEPVLGAVGDVAVPAAGAVLGLYAAWLAITAGRVTAADPDHDADRPPTPEPDPDREDAPAAGGGPATAEAHRGPGRADGTDRGAVGFEPAPADAFERLREAPPESAAPRGAAVSGAAFDRAVRVATADASSPSRERARRSLRDLAAAVEARCGEGTDADADPIDAGEWTDDRIAAAFLAADDAVTFPRRHRLYAWLDPDAAVERRTERTVAAIEKRIDESEGIR